MEFAGFELGEVTEEIIIDGKKKLVLCPLGVLAVYMNGWREHGHQKSHEGLRRYCEYISMRGYRGGATKALAELDSLDIDGARHGWGAHIPAMSRTDTPCWAIVWFGEAG